jgi:3-hydroxyisobutyrate dehydrogenase
LPSPSLTDLPGLLIITLSQITMHMKKIAVLGLGKMGYGIASHLLQCGYTVLVWNRSYSKAEELISRGAIWAETPASAASEVSVVISMVADDEASSAVWMGDFGAFKTLRRESFVIECSTLSADHVTRISTIAKENGFRYIDCPVTGLPDAAANGKLTLLVGADVDHLKIVKPVLEDLSENIRYFGAVGTGSAYKLIINLMGAVQIAALAEGLALSDRLGMDRETVIEAIESSAAASPQVIRYTRKMAELTFSKDPLFTTSLRHKDAIYGVKLAESVQSSVPLGKAATLWFKAASDADPSLDEATVINMINK